MRVFVAGATGAIGQFLVPQLVQQGHEVIALVRDARKVSSLATTGVQTVVADALDRAHLTAAIERSAPHVIIHQLTALANVTGNLRKFDQEFALTNRFRTEVTDTMLAAARNAGVRRFIAQSFCGWPFARVGGPLKTEEDPLDPDPPASFRETLAAIRYLEDTIRRTTNLEPLALRYGFFYGPGTGIAHDGAVVKLVRARKFPVVGKGTGIWSFIHLRDAAAATVAAVSRGVPGIYNIVDDEPAPVSAWLPYLAEVVGAAPPRRVPKWLARIVAGEAAVSMMTQIRGAANARAKRELAWQPTYASWRQGFVDGL